MESVSKKNLEHQSSTPKRLDIHYLKAITNNFSQDLVLGRGGYGTVYKGEQENGEVFAVKKLTMTMAEMDDKKFMNEVQHVMDIFHPNIVRLEGYCYQIEKELTFYNGRSIFVEEVYRLLCFEYLPNGSLAKYLSDGSSGLDWHTRYNIIGGICMGLYCLHEGREGAPILHLDLKPSNILLDKNMAPKIADFGLSRLFDEGKTHTSTRNLIGSCGYMAPEYINRFILSKETDIFSFGVIIVEIVAGHRKYPEASEEEFTEVYEKWRARLQKTSNKTTLEEECRQVDLCIEIGLKCMAQDPKRRPNIREIVEILKRNECSVKDDSSDGKQQSAKSVHQEWREIIDIIVSGSAEQTIEALEAIGLGLNRWNVDTCVLPKYIIEEADSLVSSLTLMVQKTFSSNTVVSFSRHRKYTLAIIMQVVRLKHLVGAVKKGNLEELVTEMLIRLSAEEVVKIDDGSQLVNSLDVAVVKILENADRMSLSVILINLLRPLDPSVCPSCTPLELLVVKNNRFSEYVWKYERSLSEDLESTINDLDLDLILQSIHSFLEPVGTEEIRTRFANEDKPLGVVDYLLEELVKLVGSKIKNHLSMVPIDAEPRPIILACIDLCLEAMAAEAARTSVPTGQTSHGGHDASSGTNPSTSFKHFAAAATTSVPPAGQTSQHSLAIGDHAASISANKSSDLEDHSGKLVHEKWRETLHIIVSDSAEQSIKALKAIGIELNVWIVDTCALPKYIIEDADILVSSLTLMVQKAFSSNTAVFSSRHHKYTLTIIKQVVQIRHLVRAVKKGTLEELVMEILIWMVKMDKDDVKMDLEILKDLIAVVDNIMENTERTSLFVILINLLWRLDPSRWPSPIPLELLYAKNNRLSDSVMKYLSILRKDLKSTVNGLDLNLILQSIHAFFEQVGIEELRIRDENGDKPLRIVVELLEELVNLVGSKIKGHLSMVPIDAEPMPIIVRAIDLQLEDLAAATTLVPFSHGGDAAYCSTNPSTLSPSEIAKMPRPQDKKNTSPTRCSIQ